jgi:hypothetical protein
MVPSRKDAPYSVQGVVHALAVVGLVPFGAMLLPLFKLWMFFPPLRNGVDEGEEE